MKKHNLFALMILPLLLGGLSSCSDTSSTSNGGSSSTDPVEITFWHTSGQTVIRELNKKIEDFSALVKENEGVDVKITLSYQGSYDDQLDKILKGFPTGNYPTIAVAYPDHVAEYLESEGSDPGRYVVNLQDYIDNPETTFGAEEWLGDGPADDFVTAFYEEGSSYAREGIYSLPLMKSSEVLYYNVDLALAYAYRYDSTINNRDALDEFINNLSWDKFMDFCQFILDDSQSSNPITRDLVWPAYYDSDENLFISQSYQAGIPFIDINDSGEGEILFNNDEAKSMVSSLKDCYDRGLFTTKGANADKYGSEYFSTGQVVFDVGSSGGAGYQYPQGDGFDVGIARVPSIDNNPLYVTQGLTLCLLKTPDDVDGRKADYAWKFLKYLTSSEVNAELCVNGSEGYVPVRTSSYDTDFFNIFLEEGEFVADVADTVINEIDGHYLNTPCFKGSAAAREAAGGIITQVFLHGDIDGAFEEAENQAKLAM